MSRCINPPEERGESTALGEPLEEFGKLVAGVVAVADPNFDRVVEGAEVLPYHVCDAIAAKDEQESLAEDTRESKGDVPKENISGLTEVMSSVEDV